MQDLLDLHDWLQGQGCTHLAMESTGVDWRPSYNLLEGDFELLVVNAHHLKTVPGRKTDGKDAEWMADLGHAWVAACQFHSRGPATGIARADQACGRGWWKSALEKSIGCKKRWKTPT